MCKYITISSFYFVICWYVVVFNNFDGSSNMQIKHQVFMVPAYAFNYDNKIFMQSSRM